MRFLRWLAWWRPPCLLRKVIVNRRDSEAEALQGVLWLSRGPWLVLKEAQLLRPNMPPQQIDGDVVIERSNVAFIQVL